MNMVQESARITISKAEYDRLKALEERFEGVLFYISEVEKTRQSRREAEEGRVIDQEKLFQELSL